MSADSLCYIMDYSGNYFRVNKADQLVVAAGEKEATVFTYAQANSRVCVGKKSSFYCMIPIEEEREIEMSCELLKELTYDELQEPAQKNVSSYDLSEMDWSEYLTHFTYVASGIKDYRDELARRHSDIEQKICDILHYVELCETDEEEAVDLVELLRVCRENRRDIKDELMRIEYFQNNFGTSANVAKAKQALKSMKGLETRKYKPRKYDELFENCAMKDRHRKKAAMDVEDAGIENTKMKYKAVQTIKDVGGEDCMIEERKYTPYDGKENDWLAFARQQAEFYRNAGQYIENLRITINEIELEIEDILQETEVANCNVAQGYKVFKRLKELRLERKVKSQELNCLYALTDYIDCDALADTCEGAFAEVKEIMNVKDESIVMNVQVVGDEPEQIQVVDTMRDMVG